MWRKFSSLIYSDKTDISSASMCKNGFLKSKSNPLDSAIFSCYSAALKAIKSNAVRRVYLLELTNTKTGLSRLWLFIALKAGLFIVAILGQ